MVKFIETLKMDFKQILKKNNLYEFIKFALVGASGTFINIGILWFLTEILGIHYIVSEIIAFIVSGISNYILNKIWTFQERINQEPGMKYIKFLIISIIALLVNISILFILVEFFDMWYIFAEVYAIAGAFILNYIGNKLWTFNND